MLMKKTLFIKNAAVLTLTSLAFRLAGIVFKVWLAKKIGADGIGLYGLVFSLYTVAAAGTASGLPVAVTRLVSEQVEKKDAMIMRLIDRLDQKDAII